MKNIWEINKICVVGWYFFNQFYKNLSKISPFVYIVAHRYNKILDKMNFNYTVTENIGLEFGAYNWYLKNIWDKKSNILFSHDDIKIKGIQTLAQVIKCCNKKQIDQTYIVGGKYSKHGRSIYMSKKMLNFFLKENNGISYDKTNNGFFNDTDKQFNFGIDMYHKTVSAIADRHKKLKIIGRVRNPNIIFYRRGDQPIPNIRKQKDVPIRESKKDYLDTKKVRTAYTTFLQDKKVVIVSAVPHMKGSKQGDFIESYDIVVRMQQGYIFPKKLRQDIGSRTDILYTSFGDDFILKLYENSEKLIEKIKWISFVTPHFWRRARKWQKKVNHKKIPIHMIDVEKRKLLSSKIGLEPDKKNPTTGMVTIFDLLQYDIRELYITGFTFYKKIPNSDGSFYYPEYQGLWKNSSEKNKKEEIFKQHSPDIEFEYFKNLYRKDKRIKCDKTLRNLLEIY